MSVPFVLGIRPPVYCFKTIYPTMMPTGLLSVLAVVEAAGYDVGFLDFFGNEKKVPSCLVQSPPVVAHVDKLYYRYGLPQKEIDCQAGSLRRRPDVIFVTSGITFWYLGLKEVLSYVRAAWPGVPVVLGGTYATLFPEHARSLGFDMVVEGEGEARALEVLGNLTHFQTSYNVNSADLDSYPVPLWRLTGGLKGQYEPGKFIAYHTSRGCCFSCSYCASNYIYSLGYRRRSPGQCVSDLEGLVASLNLSYINLQDDQLLHRPEEYVKPFLQKVITSPLLSRVKFMAPNSVDSSFIDLELALLFRQAKFRKVYLSIEVLDPVEQKRMGRNPKTEDVERAVSLLHQVGYQAKDIFVYVLMGLPGQRKEAVVDTVSRVWGIGAIPSVLGYTPIPHTVEWKRAVKAGHWQEDIDPVALDIGAIPCQSKGLTYKDATKIRKHTMHIRRSILGNANLFGTGEIDRLFLGAVSKWAGKGPAAGSESVMIEETRQEENTPQGLGGHYFRLSKDMVGQFGLKSHDDPFYSLKTLLDMGLPVSRSALIRWDSFLHPVMVGGHRHYSVNSLRVLEVALAEKNKGTDPKDIKKKVSHLKSAGILPEPYLTSSP